jgi:RNA polymerase sigma factor (sigma-70 family)
MDFDIATQEMGGASDRIIVACAEALFTSDISFGSSPAKTAVTAAIRSAIRARGVQGCEGEVAAAYGDRPETAAARMRWARCLIEEIYVPDAMGLSDLVVACTKRGRAHADRRQRGFSSEYMGVADMGKAGDAAVRQRECSVDNKRDDATLIGRAASGDEGAWELIIARYTPYMGTIARAYFLSREEICDAMQQTWMGVVAHLPDLRDPARFRPWLAAIMRHSCAEMIKHRRRGREQLAGDLTDLMGGELRDERVDVECEVLAAERTSIVRHALRLLPERERKLLHCLAADELSYDEITRRLSMPLGSIGPTRTRALRRLREILEETQAGEMLLSA